MSKLLTRAAMLAAPMLVFALGAGAETATVPGAPAASQSSLGGCEYKAAPRTVQDGAQVPTLCDPSGRQAVTTTPGATTWQARITLTAATDTALTAVNVTMDYGTLPAAAAFHQVILVPPSSCTFGYTLAGQTASATVGMQIGNGTFVGSDSINMTGIAGVPHLYSAAGCTGIYLRGN